MATEKFNWKSLFINDNSGKEDNSSNKNDSSNSLKEFPTSVNAGKPKAFPTQAPTQTSSLNQKTLESVLEMYEKGFDSLNLPGYDFYEFFKSIMAIDPDNSQAYVMAYTMAQSMDNKLSKETLVSKSHFYVSEIGKVHNEYEIQGTQKKADIVSVQKNEKLSLTNEISELQNKIKTFQKDLDSKARLLGSIDSKYSSKIVEIEDKLTANNIAKDTILNTINKVVLGIKNYIK